MIGTRQGKHGDDHASSYVRGEAEQNTVAAEPLPFLDGPSLFRGLLPPPVRHASRPLVKCSSKSELMRIGCRRLIAASISGGDSCSSQACRQTNLPLRSEYSASSRLLSQSRTATQTGTSESRT